MAKKDGGREVEGGLRYILDFALAAQYTCTHAYMFRIEVDGQRIHVGAPRRKKKQHVKTHVTLSGSCSCTNDSVQIL